MNVRCPLAVRQDFGQARVPTSRMSRAQHDHTIDSAIEQSEQRDPTFVEHDIDASMPKNFVELAVRTILRPQRQPCMWGGGE